MKIKIFFTFPKVENKFLDVKFFCNLCQFHRLVASSGEKVERAFKYDFFKGANEWSDNYSTCKTSKTVVQLRARKV